MHQIQRRKSGQRENAFHHRHRISPARVGAPDPIANSWPARPRSG